MRSFIPLLISLLFWPSVAMPQTGRQIVDDRAPFAIELPELNTGILPAGAHLEIPVPAKPPITRIKVWVVPPFADRVGYRGINVMLNDQSLSTVTKKGSGTAGIFLDVNLSSNPNLQWKTDKNVLDVTAQEEKGNTIYHCTFVLLPGKSSSVTRRQNASLAEGCATEVRTTTFLAPEDPHVLQNDRVAPQLTLTAPQAAFNATTVAQSVLVAGSASDDGGIVRTITVNGQIVASAPVTKEKRFKLPPIKKGDKKNVPAPPAPLTFNTSFLVNPGTRALLIEATDHSGNRMLVTVPIIQPDCAGATIAQRQAALASATTTGFSGRRYAVIVGVSDYQYSEGGLNDLQFADQDARALAAWLRKPEGGGFKEREIVCLTNNEATKNSVRLALAGFLDKAEANDLVYLFLAGHGAPDPFDASKLYFLLYDSKVADLPGTALPMRELGNFVNKKSEQARLIAFFDTCHSAGIKGQPLPVQPAAKTPAPTSPQEQRDKRGVGNKPKPSSPGGPSPVATPPPTAATGFNFYETQLFAGKGWTVITSSGMNEFSQESAQWKDVTYSGHGVFTWALLKGLQGEADNNKDCRITAGELAQYITRTVRDVTGGEQNPQTLPGSSSDLDVAFVPAANCRKAERK